MYSHYLAIAWRIMTRYRLFNLINIIGLAIGICAFLLISLFVKEELGYDSFWQDADRIYRVQSTLNAPGQDPVERAVSPGPMKQALTAHFPDQVQSSARLQWMYPSVKYADKLFSEVVYRTDSEMADILSLNVLSGDIHLTLADASSIAIDKTMALRLFGHSNPMGELLELAFWGVNRTFKVGAVFSDLPDNTIFDFKALIKLSDNDSPGMLDPWQNLYIYTFVKLKQQASAAQINQSMELFVKQKAFLPDTLLNHRPVEQVLKMHLMPLTRIQHHSPGHYEVKPTAELSVVTALMVLAVLILTIGTVNFINLSLSQSANRAKEVALRKLMGASRKQLLGQFVMESVLISLIALITGLLLLELLLPVFSQFSGYPLNMHYTDLSLMGGLVCLTLLIGIVAGAYPASVIAALRPAQVLTANRSSEPPSSSRLRRLLVILQFGFSSLLIIAASLVYLQTQYVINLDTGFKRHNMLIIDNIGVSQVREKLPLLKQRLEQLPEVVSLAYSDQHPVSNMGANMLEVSLPQSHNAGKQSMGTLSVTLDFFKTYGIQLLAGRSYDRAFTADGLPDNPNGTGTVVLNRKATLTLGFTDPSSALGKLIRIEQGELTGFTLQVIGVIPDIPFKSRRNGIDPEMYLLRDSVHVMNLQYAASEAQMLPRLEQVWRSLFPDVPFAYQFTSQVMAAQFNKENTVASMLGYFSALAISIACLGLLGLASYTVKRRTREIGIRKVMGANTRHIVTLLLWQFSRPVLLANVIAWPVASTIMLYWLQQFPYRIEAWWLIPICVLATASTLLIAWLTVAGNVLKVARQKPIKALRYE